MTHRSCFVIVLGFLFLGTSTGSKADVAFDASGMGIVILGYDSRTCESSIEGAMRYDDGSNVGTGCAEMTDAVGIGEYCAYIDMDSDGSYFSICADGTGTSNEFCSTTVSPGDTICVYGYDATSIRIKFGGVTLGQSYGGNNNLNGNVYSAYQGDGSGNGDGPWCDGGIGGSASNAIQVCKDAGSGYDWVNWGE